MKAYRAAKATNADTPTNAQPQQIATDISDADRASLALLRTHELTDPQRVNSLLEIRQKLIDAKFTTPKSIDEAEKCTS